MTDKLKGIFIAIAAIAALAAGGAAIAGAAGGEQPGNGQAAGQGSTQLDEAREERDGPDDDAGEADEQVTGAAADRASAAAIKAAGGGSATEVEIADEGDSGYEVEVKRPNGTFVEVALDRAFKVVSVESDDD